MNDERPITKHELDLHIQKLVLEIKDQINTILDEKFEKLQDRFDDANITRRDHVIFEVTGFPFDERQNVRIAIQHAYKEAIRGADTRDKLKKTLINYIVPLVLAGTISWVVSHWDKTGG